MPAPHICCLVLQIPFPNLIIRLAEGMTKPLVNMLCLPVQVHTSNAAIRKLAAVRLAFAEEEVNCCYRM